MLMLRPTATMPPKILTDLPADVVQHIVVRLTLAHHIARIAPTCKVVSVAARNAIKVRRFSSEVVTLAGHVESVRAVAAAPDGRVITGAHDSKTLPRSHRAVVKKRERRRSNVETLRSAARVRPRAPFY